MKKLWLIPAFLFASSSAFAICEDKVSQLDRNECIAKHYQTVDKKLNIVYQNYVKTLDKQDKKILVKSQRGWVDYKENDCFLESQRYAGGSLQPQVQLKCLINKTEQRIKELDKLKNCSPASSAEMCM